MGLDVHTYQHAHRTPDHERVDSCYDDWHHVHAFVSGPFERSLRGLIADRCYLTSGKELNFSVNYSGHNHWRAELCRLALEVEPEDVWAAPTDWADQPFFELIHFSDAEGTIGPEAADGLAEDFRSHRNFIRPVMAEKRPDWAELYDDWQAAFELAAGSGVVVFS